MRIDVRGCANQCLQVRFGLDRCLMLVGHALFKPVHRRLSFRWLKKNGWIHRVPTRVLLFSAATAKNGGRTVSKNLDAYLGRRWHVGDRRQDFDGARPGSGGEAPRMRYQFCNHQQPTTSRLGYASRAFGNHDSGVWL